MKNIYFVLFLVFFCMSFWLGALIWANVVAFRVGKALALDLIGQLTK